MNANESKQIEPGRFRRSHKAAPISQQSHTCIYIYIKWANALVPPTPFSGRSGGERSKRPTCAVVQTCTYYRVFEGLGSVNIDCGTMNRMY